MKWCHNFSQDNAKLSHCLLGNEKKFSQIFYDTDYEELARDQIPQQYGGSVDQNLLSQIQTELHWSNELYKSYKPIGLEVLAQPEKTVYCRQF